MHALLGPFLLECVHTEAKYSTHKLIFEQCPLLCQMCGFSVSTNIIVFDSISIQIKIETLIQNIFSYTSTGICRKHEIPYIVRFGSLRLGKWK